MVIELAWTKFWRKCEFFKCLQRQKSNLSQDTSTWYIPKISGKISGSRYDYKANVIGKYMVISFGKYYIFFIIDFYMIINFVVNKQLF